jgi:hypothetical protein
LSSSASREYSRPQSQASAASGAVATDCCKREWFWTDARRPRRWSVPDPPAETPRVADRARATLPPCFNVSSPTRPGCSASAFCSASAASLYRPELKQRRAEVAMRFGNRVTLSC